MLDNVTQNQKKGRNDR